MERKRQQTCVGIGSVLLMALGVGMLILWKINRNIVIEYFQNKISTWLLWAGSALLCLGTLGACSIWRWSRCLLCTFAWLAVVVGHSCAIGGVILFIEPSSVASQLERTCQTANSTSEIAKANPKFAAAQDSYDSMYEALLACRRQNQMAIRLSACPGAQDSAGRLWMTNPHKDIFRWMENRFACSGFCKDEPSLFALPRGTVNEANRGRLRPACYTSVAIEMRRQAIPSASVMFVVGIFLLCPASCACWWACAPPPFRRSNYVHHPEELGWTTVSQVDEDSDVELTMRNS